MTGFWLLCAVGAAIIIFAGKQRIDGLEDDFVNASSIRNGVANGWYSATLVMVDNIYAVRLTGKKKDGETYTDIYRVSPEDWNALKNEGYDVKI